MNLKYLCLSMVLAMVLSFQSCGGKMEEVEVEKTKVEEVFEASLAAHGGDRYDNAEYEFVFRDKTYTFKNGNNGSYYTSTHQKGDSLIFDEMINGKISRKINGELQILSVKDRASYHESLNSVVYFATLPHKLKDKAVNKEYKGEITIKGELYEILKVTFDQEGGGVDHDDNFYYWINKASNLIDYLAYNYTVNKGGVRFRAANNTRKVDGIVFQDYVNYKAELGTPLDSLPILFEAGKLIKLSEINTEEVKSLRGRE